MTDILDTLKSYPDDPTIVMSRRVVNDIIAEIERLTAELAAEREQKIEAMAAVHRAVDMKIEAEDARDELRALLCELREWFTPYNKEILARIDAALNKGGADE